MKNRCIFLAALLMGCSSPDAKSPPAQTTAGMKESLAALKAKAEAVPENRSLAKGARLLTYRDLVSEKPPVGRTSLERTFVEVEDCAGDSLFTEYYSDGMIDETGHTSVHFVGSFATGPKGIKVGMSKADLTKALGRERWSSDQVVIYSCVDPVEREHGHPDATYECGWFFFENGERIGLSYHVQFDC